MRFVRRVFITVLLLCALSKAGSAQLLFHKTFSSPKEDNPEHALPLPDGGVVICGDVIIQSPYSSHVFLTRLDSNGNSLWTKYYFATQAHAVKVFPASDGGYYVSGYAYFAPNNWGFSLMKTDSIGNQEWLRLFAGSGPNDVKRTSDGGFIYGGSILTMMFSTISICKTDSLGNPEWHKIYFRDDVSNCSAIEQTYDGGYLVTGSTRSFGFSAGNSVMYVMKLDSIGNVEWNKVVTDTFGMNQGIGKAIVRNDYDSTYSIACLLPYLSVITLKQDFTVASINQYYPSGNAMAHDISLTSDGGYLLTTENNGQACVIKLDSARNAEWYKNFESLQTIYFSSSLTSFESEPGIYWTITNNSLNNGDVNVCRYTKENTLCDSSLIASSMAAQVNVLDSLYAQQSNSLAMVSDTFVEQNLIFSNVFLCSSQLDAIDEVRGSHTLKIYPNPASTELYIEADSLTSPTNYRVFDAIGRCVRTGTIEPGFNRIQITDLPSGLYTLFYDDEALSFSILEITRQ